jgi:hypothetical protein
MKVEDLLYFVIFYNKDYEFFLDDEREDFLDEHILEPHNIDKYSIKRSMMDDEMYAIIVKEVVDLINECNSDGFFSDSEVGRIKLWKNIKNSYNIHINNDLICAKITISEEDDDDKELSKVYNEEHTDGLFSGPNLFTYKGVDYMLEWG